MRIFVDFKNRGKAEVFNMKMSSRSLMDLDNGNLYCNVKLWVFLSVFGIVANEISLTFKMSAT